MTPDEKYLFDLNGYIVVKGVLSPAEVALANESIDKRSSQLVERKGNLRLSGSKGLGGDGSTGRADLGGMLEWEGPDGDPYRSILAHPRLLPYFNELLGTGYRMDHLPLLITQRKGAEGFTFHGGATGDDGGWSYDLHYEARGGRMRTTLLALGLMLTPAGPGDGGFCVIPGSHKSSFPCPKPMKEYEAYQEFVRQPVVEPGDVVLFTEAATHGTLSWQADHQRRTVIYRFAPANFAYGRSYYPEWPGAMMEHMTPAQAAVLEPPYNVRLDRAAPVVPSGDHATEEEVVVPVKRAKHKIEHDTKIFGTKYF